MARKATGQKEMTRRELFAGVTAVGVSALGGNAFSPQTLAEPTRYQTVTPPHEVKSGTTPESAEAGTRLNVLYIVADDLGWADVGYHAPSEIRTPYIDRLVGEGIELDRFYGCPVCSPSRACALTGRSPMRYGMIYAVVRPWATHGIPQEERLLPEAFHSAGYQTWMVGKWHLGHWNAKLVPNARGFEHFYGFVSGEINYFDHTREGALDWQRNRKPIEENGYSTDLFADEAVRLIEGRDKNRPFFMYLPFNAPHQPLMAPEDLVQSYAAIKDRKRRTYAAMVTSMDKAIGRICQALERSGAAEHTLIVFHGDNGGQLLQGGINLPLRDGKSTVFEGGIRVPAFLHCPGILPGGIRSSQVLSNLDIFPTIASAAKIKAGNTLDFDGHDLWQVLRSNQIMPREELFFAVGERGYWSHAIIRKEWKLVVEENQEDHAKSTFLFQLEEDPFEKNNVAEHHPDLVKDLTDRIRQWRSLHPEGDIDVSSKRHPGFAPPSDWSESAIT